MPWAGFSLGRRRPANLERPIVVVLGLNLLLLLLLHHGPRSALIGYILPQPRHLDQKDARLLGHSARIGWLNSTSGPMGSRKSSRPRKTIRERRIRRTPATKRRRASGVGGAQDRASVMSPD